MNKRTPVSAYRKFSSPSNKQKVYVNSRGTPCISFNTHPPPPNDDIWQEWLGVGMFTTHPPWRNNDIFLKKRGFRKDISAIKFHDYFCFFFKPSLICNYLSEWQKAWGSWVGLEWVLCLTWTCIELELGSSEGVKYNPKSLFWNSDILSRHPPTSMTCHYF